VRAFYRSRWFKPSVLLAIFVVGVVAMLIHRPDDPFHDVEMQAIIIVPYLVLDWWMRRNR
jgi:hypothetical protein